MFSSCVTLRCTLYSRAQRKSEPATHVGGPDPEVPDVVLVPRVILELPRASLQEVELLLKSGASGKEQEFCRQIAGRAR